MVDYGIRYNERAQLKIYNRIVASFFCLPEDERLVLLFILQRTVGWGKAWKTISPQDFSTGVFRGDAGQRNVIIGGTGLASDRVTQALRSLQGMGAVEAHELGRQTIYRIIEDWCHPELPTEGRYRIWSVHESEYAYDEAANQEE